MPNRNQGEIDEVAALQQAIGAKELLLREREAAFEDLERRLSSTIKQLGAELTEKQTLIGQSEIKSQQAIADVTEIVEQKTRLEMLQKQTERLLSAQAEQIRAGVRAEIQSLEKQLIDKESELQNCHACAKEAERSHAAELTRLQHRLAEMQLLSEARALQIADLKVETVRLSQEINRREPVKFGTGACGNSESEQSRRSEAGSDEVQARLKANSLISAKAETTARHEIRTARQDAEEKHLLLASRNEELVRVKAEMDLLQAQMCELNLSSKRIQESAETECAKMRTEFQAQLAFLQAELSLKEWALEERQAAQKVLEQGLRAKIGQLEIQLAQRKTSGEPPAQDFILGDNCEAESQLDHTWKLQERLDGNSAESAPTASNYAGKWRNSGEWKRRWRSR
jgi:hypothetical protein